ncbi:hypothetical protein ASG90_06180 [Nocardioides sp. Soil797]|nr:hypothetical protein ASG90_06180 [Nocardioides sp. Soil797]
MLNVLAVIGGTVFAEVSLKEGFRGDYNSPWNLLFVEGMHPFGYSGLILDEERAFALTYSNSLGYFVLGLVVMAVVVFLVSLLVLGSLVPGRSVLATWVGAWFAIILGSALGALAVDVARVLADDAPRSGYGLWVGARQFFAEGAYWGLVFGWLIGAVVAIFWVARGSGRAKATPAVNPAGPYAAPGQASYAEGQAPYGSGQPEQAPYRPDQLGSSGAEGPTSGPGSGPDAR